MRRCDCEESEKMDVRKIVVVVEDEDVARTALRWALHNLLRVGDVIVLLHVFAASRREKRTRKVRLRGFQLALSFKEICGTHWNTNVEIIVAQGKEVAGKIAAVVRELGASFLVVGLHDRSFLYRVAMENVDPFSSFSCRVMAIKQPSSTLSSTKCSPKSRSRDQSPLTRGSASFNLDFSQIELAGLQLPEYTPSKISYQICPDPYTILWRWKRRRRS